MFLQELNSPDQSMREEAHNHFLELEDDELEEKAIKPLLQELRRRAKTLSFDGHYERHNFYEIAALVDEIGSHHRNVQEAFLNFAFAGSKATLAEMISVGRKNNNAFDKAISDLRKYLQEGSQRQKFIAAYLLGQQGASGDFMEVLESVK